MSMFLGTGTMSNMKPNSAKGFYRSLTAFFLGGTMKIVVRVGKCFLKFNSDQITHRVTGDSEELNIIISLSIPTIQRVIKRARI